MMTMDQFAVASQNESRLQHGASRFVVNLLQFSQMKLAKKDSWRTKTMIVWHLLAARGACCKSCFRRRFRDCLGLTTLLTTHLAGRLSLRSIFLCAVVVHGLGFQLWLMHFLFSPFVSILYRLQEEESTQTTPFCVKIREKLSSAVPSRVKLNMTFWIPTMSPILLRSHQMTSTVAQPNWVFEETSTATNEQEIQTKTKRCMDEESECHGYFLFWSAKAEIKSKIQRLWMFRWAFFHPVMEGRPSTSC